jgi:hypothetical protein
MAKFKKGESGNPSGRPKSDQELKDALDKVIGGPDKYAAKLIEFMDFASDHSIKLAAFKMVMEYRFGKPRQQIEVEGGENPVKFIITGLPEIKPDAGRKN